MAKAQVDRFVWDVADVAISGDPHDDEAAGLERFHPGHPSQRSTAAAGASSPASAARRAGRGPRTTRS